MLNLLYALAAGTLVTAALRLSHLLSFAEAVVPGVLVALVAYVVLARRTFAKLQQVMQQAGQYLQTAPPKIPLAAQALQAGYPLAREQFGVRSQLDAQLGVMYFLTREFAKAQPLLARAYMWTPWNVGAMLGVLYYKKKDHAAMKRAFDVVLRKGRNQGLAYNLYAYLLQQIGEREAAQKILVRGVAQVKDSDPRVNEALLALQNGKKFKMRAYREQWYQFHLENPPATYQQAPVGQQRMGRLARRGRW